MGKIKVNLQGAKPSPQQREYPSYDDMAGFNLTSAPEASGYTRPGMYEPQRNVSQPQQPKGQQQPQFGSRSRPSRQSQPSAPHPFYSDYSADPFGQYFSPYQQRPQQQQPSRHHANPSSRQTHHPQQQQQPPPSTQRPAAEPLPSRNEGGLLQESGKQYSIASTQTFTKLDTIKAKFNDLLSKVNNIETTTNKEETESLLKSKNLLAQISGDIDRLQFTGLDAIDTSLLHTGKDEARTKRKKLNRDIEELQQHVQDLHKIYEEMGCKMTQHESDRQQVESGNTTATDSEEEIEGSNQSGAHEETTIDDATTVPEATTESESVEESTTGEMETEVVPTATAAAVEGNPPSSAESNEIETQRAEEDEEVEEEIGESTKSPSQVREETEEEQEETPIEETSAEAREGEEEMIPSVETEIDMTDWVIEDSSSSAPPSSSRESDVMKLKQQLSEKDEIIRQLREQLVEKDKLLAEQVRLC